MLRKCHTEFRSLSASCAGCLSLNAQNMVISRSLYLIPANFLRRRFCVSRACYYQLCIWLRFSTSLLFLKTALYSKSFPTVNFCFYEVYIPILIDLKLGGHILIDISFSTNPLLPILESKCMLVTIQVCWLPSIM